MSVIAQQPRSGPAALFVGDLPVSAQFNKDGEQILYGLFSQFGPIVSVRICRDRVDENKCLGYGYVNFENAENAAKAIEILNYSHIPGFENSVRDGKNKEKRIRVQWSNRDPSFRRSNVGNIVIKSLDKTFTPSELHDFFSQFGPIASCKLREDGEGNSIGIAYIHFQREEDANKVIQNINNKTLESGQGVKSTVIVEKFVTRNERQKSNVGFTNVYVKEIPHDFDKSQFEKLFSEHGIITSTYLKESSKEGEKNVGFGFVNFENHNEALKAIEAMHGKEINGKKLYVVRAQSRSERTKELQQQRKLFIAERNKSWEGRNLYVKQIHESVDDKYLQKLFSEFGELEVSPKGEAMCHVARDRNNPAISRLFGYVLFKKTEDAKKAKEELNAKMDHGYANDNEDKPLYVNFWQSKEKRVQMRSRPPLGFNKSQPGMLGGQQRFPQFSYPFPYPFSAGSMFPQVPRGMAPLGGPRGLPSGPKPGPMGQGQPRRPLPGPGSGPGPAQSGPK